VLNNNRLGHVGVRGGLLTEQTIILYTLKAKQPIIKLHN